jgi:hypothetical protein
VAAGVPGSDRLVQRRRDCEVRRLAPLRAAAARELEAERKLAAAMAGRDDRAPAVPEPVPEAADVAPAAAADAASAAPARPGGALGEDPTESPAERSPAAGRLPTGLERSAAALFDGRYRDALVSARELRSDRPRARAQAHLLESAACFALSRLEVDPAWAECAAAARDRARREDPSLQPLAGYFAPAFRAFFTAAAEARSD